eukprot:g2993.t1
MSSSSSSVDVGVEEDEGGMMGETEANNPSLAFLSNASALYGVKYPCRCIQPRLAEKRRHQFIVGSTSLKDENEVHLLDFDEDAKEVRCLAVMNHPNEIWDLKPCPFDPDLLFTCHSDGLERQVTLWRMRRNTEGTKKASKDGNADDETEDLDEYGDTLQEVLALPKFKERVQSVMWESTVDETPRTDSRAVSLHESSFRVWSLRRGCTESNVAAWTANEGERGETNAARTVVGSWDPIHSNTVAIGSGTSIYAWDLRTMKQSHHIAAAHAMGVRDVDFNANKPWSLLTGGEDGVLKFWDLRQATRAIKVVDAHRHWITSAKFNPNHDQLVISSSTDHTVKLWRMSSISSAPLQEVVMEEEEDCNCGSDEDDASSKPVADGLIKCFEEHEDSVYSVTWSACEPWYFASVSHDGRVVVGNVPSAEKYRILLD